MLSTKKIRRVVLLPLLLAVLLGGCQAVAPVAPVVADEVTAVSEQNVESADAEALSVEVASSEVSLTESVGAEADALLYMREEEKLAHDVYVVLYDLWGLPIFDNISNSESQHMDAVLQALEARGLADPAAGNGLGEFTDPELQALYDILVAQGSQSAVAALTVGATIEDVDIADLQEALQTANADDVRWIFENLLRGSENHIRAFVRNLERYGESYEPQYVDADYYESVVDDSTAVRGGVGQGRLGGAGRGAGRP